MTSAKSRVESENDVQDLPDFMLGQFDLASPPECDMVLKGGVTSGIVYPYAVLQLATKYRFRSIGGTSAGAIAGAFAAAAEYGRLNGRPDSFLTLKKYCDELPERLLSLFQPSPALVPAVESAKAILVGGSIGALMKGAPTTAVISALGGAAVFASVSHLFQPMLYSTSLAGVLGAVAGTLGGLVAWGWLRWKKTVEPIVGAVKDLPKNNFGFCTGLSQPGNGDNLALTDWMHRAIQHIAFGNPDHPVPLTFGHLRGDGEKPQINLNVVTTNLSMRRPHTLPKLGMPAGFIPADWDLLFPKPVMDHIYGRASKAWRRHTGTWLFPRENELPVLVAVRMSLSFPVLFSAVPLLIEDKELPSIVKSLGGKPYKRIRKVHFSDGGISSNFPIHMFDAPLPTRPTFAFCLDELLWDAGEVKNRVAIPSTASEGMGVQIKQIRSLSDFAWQVLNSAKDWQDQLLSEITGQRERIARIFLTESEGGLNLNMSPFVSRRLMRWGYEAGCKFTDGSFDFDEHKWRRLLVLYKHLEGNLEAIEQTWGEGFGDWYEQYAPDVTSYKKLTLKDRRHIAEAMQELVAARDIGSEIENSMEKLPRKAGVLKVAPKY